MADAPDHNDNTRTHVVLTKGTMVGHYRIVEKIGAGGMGEVHLAEDTKLKRNVALKFLPPHLCRDEDCRARFTREAQAAAKLSHPNIITIHEVSEYQGRPYFAMEHVEGRSLNEFSSDKELPTDRILELAIQICEGLHEAHEKGVTHRDIKPSNILIDSHGRAKIVDFGLASVVGTDQLTKTGSTLGTIGYMSPEQVLGRDIDHRSDLFSFGVVLYELITKQNPFKRDSEAATLKAVSDDLPEPLARFKSGLPDGLQGIIDKALEKDVKTRYQHADGMLSDLMRVKRSMDSEQSIVSVSSRAGRSSRMWWITGILIIIAAVVAIVVIKPWVTGTVSDTPDKIMLAVLPFENLGDPDDEYFADGITHEITSRLAKLGGLGVISPSSALKYKNSEKEPQEISRELGVNYLLEGTIRWDKSDGADRVRITPRLMETSKNTLVWAENYERGMDAIFEVQVDIASQIVSALDITLLKPEHEAIRAGRTGNQQAYQAYLRGQDYLNRPDYSEGNFRMAVEMFQRATELDSTYAIAYARLSYAHLALYHQGWGRTDARRQSAKEAVDRALELDPDLGEAHLALGYYYYWGYRDYDRALECFGTAGRILPNNGEVAQGIMAVNRRLGNFAEAVEWGKKAFELNPRDAAYAWELGFTLEWLRRYEEATYYTDLSISIAPDQSTAYERKWSIYLSSGGDIENGRKILERIPARHAGDILKTWYYQEMLERDYDAAANRLDSAGDSIIYSQVSSEPIELLKGMAFHHMGNQDSAHLYFEMARVKLETEVDAHPEDHRIHEALGLSYAGLGMKAQAIREAKRAVELFPLTRDAFFGTIPIKSEARIYCMVDEYDRAIERLEFLLSIPSGTSVAWLKIAPDYDPLRDHPRFQSLIEKYEKEHGI